MTPFETAVEFVLKYEGGLTNNPADPGGLTKFGISQRCISPDSRVLTASLDWVNASSLVVGDKLLAFDEIPERRGKLNIRRFRVASVDSIGVVRMPASRIVTEKRQLVAGNEHQWLRRWGSHRIFNWSRTSDLLQPSGKWSNGVGVRIATLCAPWSVLQTREAGYLAGVLDGEGSISSGLEFAQKRGNALVAQALRCADTLGLKFTEGNLRHGVCSYKLCGEDSAFFHITTAASLGARRLQAIAASRLIGRTIASTKNQHDRVLFVEPVGERDLIGIGTSTHTLIVDGYLSHNSYPLLDIHGLTKEQAKEIYLRDYWDRCNCGDLPPALGVLLFDSAVNQGSIPAIRMLQRALSVQVDGVLGPITIGAAMAKPIDAAITEFIARRSLRYAMLPMIGTFGLGWFRRLAAAHQMAMSLATQNEHPEAPLV